MAELFDYNALRDDHPKERWLRFWYFLLDLSLLIMGAYFLYRYWSAWQGHSSLVWWWLIPAVLGLLFGVLGMLGIWQRGHEAQDHPERYVQLNEQRLLWWLDINETPQEVKLAEIEAAKFEFRDVTLSMKDGSERVLHTYLIMSPAKETAFREALAAVV
ncbi:MAG: hypothetical protein AAF433_05265 [Bacteroidota bacterium]